MSKMKDQATFAALSLFAAACGYHSPHFDPDVMCNPTSLHIGVNAYEPQKLTGFTQVKGRRRLTKKQRKQLKNRKK